MPNAWQPRATARGKGFILVVDANRGWSVPDAILFSRLIEHLDIQWFEEPCHCRDDAAMMARVRQATSIPVNAGQSEYTSYGVRRLLQADAVDYVNFPDASESGGITEWRRAAAMCSVFNVRMAHHEEPHLAVHMLSGVAHGSYVECFADPRRDPDLGPYDPEPGKRQQRDHPRAPGALDSAWCWTKNW